MFGCRSGWGLRCFWCTVHFFIIERLVTIALGVGRLIAKHVFLIGIKLASVLNSWR
jgi:uncharacterized membrane protein